MCPTVLLKSNCLSIRSFYFNSSYEIFNKPQDSFDKLEGKYTEWPNPQITENHACDRQSGLNDSAPRNHIPVA